MLAGCAALSLRPERLDLGEDPLAKGVAGARERERSVRVEALEAAGARLAADPTRQLRPQAPLLFVRSLDACAELLVLHGQAAEALDSACRLEAGDRRDEVRAREPERRREGLAGIVERLLLGDGRPAVGTANGYAPERARLSAQLAPDDRKVIHPS
jgi:hypothetical protein